MDNNENIKPVHKCSCKRIWWVIGAALVVTMMILVYYITLSSLATSKWVKKQNQEYAESGNSNIDPGLLVDSTYLSLQQHIAFNKARLKMAANDSIGLTINLADSLMSLEISGVTVHTAKIHSYNVSRSIGAINHTVLSGILSSPLVAKNSTSTIEKEPITIKIAPADTIEASQPDVMPDTSRVEPVFFELELNNGFKLSVLQFEAASKSERYHRNIFLLKRAMFRTLEYIKSAARFRTPDYSPEIRIMVAGPDARSFYRALPHNGKVVLFLPMRTD